MADELGIAEAKQALRRGYEHAGSLMNQNKDLDTVNEQVRVVDADFINLMKLCETMQDSDAVPGTPSTKKDFCDPKELFDKRVEQWIAQLPPAPPSASHASQRDNIETRSVRSGLSRSTSSSVLSDIRRSRVKVRLAEAALKIERSKLQEVKEQVRNDAADRAERIRREAAEKARRAQQEAEEQAARAIKEAEEDARRAEADAEQAFRGKQRELALAETEAELWEQESVGHARETVKETERDRKSVSTKYGAPDLCEPVRDSRARLDAMPSVSRRVNEYNSPLDQDQVVHHGPILNRRWEEHQNVPEFQPQD